MGKIRLKMGKYCKIRVFPGKTTALYRKWLPHFTENSYCTLPKNLPQFSEKYSAVLRKNYRSSPKKLPQFTEKATAVLRKSLAQFTEKL